MRCLHAIWNWLPIDIWRISIQSYHIMHITGISIEQCDTCISKISFIVISHQSFIVHTSHQMHKLLSGMARRLRRIDNDVPFHLFYAVLWYIACAAGMLETEFAITWIIIPGMCPNIWCCLSLIHTLIPAWISNYIHYKLWDEITYPFQNFKSCTIEV